MTILGYNPEQISSQAQVSMGDLGERIQGTKALVDDAIEKMKEQERALLEKKRKVEETLKLYKSSGYIPLLSWYFQTKTAKVINNAQPDLSTGLILVARYKGEKIINIVTSLLGHSDILINEGDMDQYTALVHASEYNSIAVAKLLLADSRLNLREHNQGKEALARTANEEIRALIEAKMQEQGIEF